MANLVGARIERKEDKKFLTGKGRYTADISLAHQTYAYFVRSPSETEKVEKTSSQSFKEALSEAFKTKSYILLVAGFFVCGFHITLVGTHVPKYVVDRGLEDWTAAAILSLIGIFNLFSTNLWTVSGTPALSLPNNIVSSGLNLNLV